MLKNARHMFYGLLSCVLTVSHMLPTMLKLREICNLFKVTVCFLQAVASLLLVAITKTWDTTDTSEDCVFDVISSQ